MAQEEKVCNCHKTKERSEKEYKDLIHRLNRIEGQIRGIKGMVERDAYCTDKPGPFRFPHNKILRFL